MQKSASMLAATSASAMMPGAVFTKGFGAVSEYAKLTGAEHAGQLANTELLDALVLRAVNAGKEAGASFIDARITRVVVQEQNGPYWTDRESVQMGVRAFVNGVWGFASSPYCDLDEAALLAKSAVSQAKINAAVFPRDIELGVYPAVKGKWSTPIKLDPFTIPMEERSDFISSFDGLRPRRVVGRLSGGSLKDVAVSRVEKTIATSDGSIYSQTLYRVGGEFKVRVNAVSPSEPAIAEALAKGVDLAAAGWERFEDAKLRDQIPVLIEEAERYLYVPVEPVMIGRYELVTSAAVAGGLMASTFANATQLDRVLGYEANAGGTSYLGPNHLQYLGTPLGNAKLTVTADRSMPLGLATTQWDDEGVVPDEFTIVDHGKLVDYQTTRDMAGLMSEWYTSRKMPVRSHGCCYATDAKQLPMLHTPNLTMQPGDGASSMDEMIAKTERGIAFITGMVGTDFQSRTGTGGGIMREIRNGKLGSILLGAQLMYDSFEIWKNLLEVGNAKSMEQMPTLPVVKGEPRQDSQSSIRSVPIRLKDMAVVDGTRKA